MDSATQRKIEARNRRIRQFERKSKRIGGVSVSSDIGRGKAILSRHSHKHELEGLPETPKKGTLSTIVAIAIFLIGIMAALVQFFLKK